MQDGVLVLLGVLTDSSCPPEQSSSGTAGFHGDHGRHENPPVERVIGSLCGRRFLPHRCVCVCVCVREIHLKHSRHTS